MNRRSILSPIPKKQVRCAPCWGDTKIIVMTFVTSDHIRFILLRSSDVEDLSQRDVRRRSRASERWRTWEVVQQYLDVVKFL